MEQLKQMKHVRSKQTLLTQAMMAHFRSCGQRSRTGTGITTEYNAIYI